MQGKPTAGYHHTVSLTAMRHCSSSFNKCLLAQRIRTCVATTSETGEDDKVNELVTMLQKVSEIKKATIKQYEVTADNELCGGALPPT